LKETKTQKRKTIFSQLCSSANRHGWQKYSWRKNFFAANGH